MRSDPPVPPGLEGHVCWILGDDGRTPVEVPLDRGVPWMNAHGTVRVALDEGAWGSVSTVFVPRFERAGLAPRLFETLVTRPDGREGTELSASWEEAERRHLAAVAALDDPGAGPSLH